MPYRRLPKTDLSRIKAIQKAVSMEGYKENGQLVLSYQTIRDAQQILSKFRSAQRQYQQYHDLFLSANKDYREEERTARMYVSHFIQVLNMAIQRGELRSDIKSGYGLDPDSTALPPLSTDEELAQWGEKVIRGEEKRIQQGGAPIYNPNIAKVKVHFSIFAEHYYSITNYKQNAEKFRNELLQMRPMVDDLLLDLWNQVEAFYAECPLSVRIEKGDQFGLIYYLRDTEKKQVEAEKLQSRLEF